MQKIVVDESSGLNMNKPEKKLDIQKMVHVKNKASIGLSRKTQITRKTLNLKRKSLFQNCKMSMCHKLTISQNSNMSNRSKNANNFILAIQNQISKLQKSNMSDFKRMPTKQNSKSKHLKMSDFTISYKSKSQNKMKKSTISTAQT